MNKSKAVSGLLALLLNGVWLPLAVVSLLIFIYDVNVSNEEVKRFMEYSFN